MMLYAFAGVTVATVWGVNKLLLRIRVARRMNLVGGGAGRTVIESRFLRRSADIRGVFGHALAALGGLLPLGEDDRQKIAVALSRAGYRSTNATAAVVGAKTACLLGGLIGGLFLLSPLLPGPAGWLVGLVGGVLLGVMLNLVPELVVARLGSRRYRRIHVGLPDALDLLIVCLESGSTFERSLQRTVADLKLFRPELAGELRLASLDLSLHGRTREDALGRLAKRLDSADLRDFAMSVTQSERHGTPLADALRKFAGSLRVRQIATMQARMARLPVLLILPTIAAVLPGIIVIVGGPAFVNLSTSLSEVGG